MSTYRNAKLDSAVANDFLAGRMPCTVCRLSTDQAELSGYGARCLGCYQSYCGQGRHYPALSIEQRKASAASLRVVIVGGLRASGWQHIEHLAALERAGQATPGQRGFLAATRRLQLPQGDAGYAQPAHRPPASAYMAPQQQADSPADADPPSWATEDAGEYAT